MRETLKLMAQLTGQLKGDGTTVNVGIRILNTPEWEQVVSVVTGALRDEPRAQEKIALALAHMANGANGTAVPVVSGGIDDRA